MAAEGPWRDIVLEHLEDDGLDRKHVAIRTAELIIETYSVETSTVIGLTGPWGSGKSSLVSMALEALDLQEPWRWSIAKFTPWSTSDTAGMMAEFYRAISENLPTATATEAARKRLGILSAVGAAALRLVPVAGETLSDISKTFTEEAFKQPSWDKAFMEASSEIAAIAQPILVVVDDVDRLQHEELTNLLRIIGLLGRFPGVSYLLAYDEQTVLSNLQQTGLGVGKRQARLFMEKIVQYPVSVPPMLPRQIIERLEAGFASAFSELG